MIPVYLARQEDLQSPSWQVGRMDRLVAYLGQVSIAGSPTTLKCGDIIITQLHHQILRGRHVLLRLETS